MAGSAPDAIARMDSDQARTTPSREWTRIKHARRHRANGLGSSAHDAIARMDSDQARTTPSREWTRIKRARRHLHRAPSCYRTWPWCSTKPSRALLRSETHGKAPFCACAVHATLLAGLRGRPLCHASAVAAGTRRHLPARNLALPRTPPPRDARQGLCFCSCPNRVANPFDQWSTRLTTTVWSNGMAATPRKCRWRTRPTRPGRQPSARASPPVNRLTRGQPFDPWSTV
jgi:hypothetical protein